MGNTFTIGERVAWYRRRRGMSQEVLAGLIGRTADWLGKVENNRIELDRLSVIKSLADVLDVTLADLLGEPSLLDWTADSGKQTLPAMRAALMRYEALLPLADDTGEPPSLVDLRQAVGELWTAYQDSRFGYVTGRLPELIGRGQAAVSGYDGEEQEQARRLLGLTYQLAATQLTKLGEADLAWLAADRGLSIVGVTGDPVVTGSLYRSVGHALHSTGRYADAVRLTERAAAYLEPHMTDPSPALLSVYGTLFLSGAMAAARANDSGLLHR
jgi:transcriptional regulator with XRE-family HTH domain